MDSCTAGDSLTPRMALRPRRSPGRTVVGRFMASATPGNTVHHHALDWALAALLAGDDGSDFFRAHKR